MSQKSHGVLYLVLAQGLMLFIVRLSSWSESSCLLHRVSNVSLAIWRLDCCARYRPIDLIHLPMALHRALVVQ